MHSMVVRQLICYLLPNEHFIFQSYIGKSIQTVTILHTLLTHPSLIRSSISTYSTSTNRLVHRVLLISPGKDRLHKHVVHNENPHIIYSLPNIFLSKYAR